jgi:2-polyprenyl-3-methyl-5-hydroxy-6-metoxy-1,4-benzoquinol methylase
MADETDLSGGENGIESPADTDTGTGSGSTSSDYVEWKGWVDQTPFGLLERGETRYFDDELRGVIPGDGRALRVLEIGYGNGSFLTYCREKGWDVIGTELEDGLLESATRAGFTALPAHELDRVPDDSFDLIAVFDVLEHIPQEHIPGMLSTLAAKLRADGRMIFRFPNADSWLGNPLQNGDPTHVTAIGYLKMTYFALQTSLDVVAFRAARRHGFQTSTANGLYKLFAGPVIDVMATVKRLLYFPALPVVLSTSNVVCVVRRRV